MTPTTQTRKPIDEIKPEDLEVFPVWEFADDEETSNQDETWIRPVDTSLVPLGATALTVGATFTTAAGMELRGYVGVSTDSDFEISHAAVLSTGQYLCVPAADYWNAEAEYAELASALGLLASDIFPLRFSLRVLIEGENLLRTGEFKG